ncbi:putative multicopper oxidase [Hypoxylon trugodes]|uniref:putative multicopper oxidase n=1 Tax=Hypoxylon trugodes TaxID=326681 RepID=UPI00219E314C|nr:putative multicopper oxidase [Hypoxylon trugodes]KAI1385834.1 putative multicopper oxidase [Hypoxylon trugodes]
MSFYETCKAVALSITTIFSLPFHIGNNGPSNQAVLSFGDINAVKASPRFPAPHGPESGESFICEYPTLGDGWESCSTPDDRECWLKGPNDTYDINTDYEIRAPPGITREYYLEVDEMPINGDGVVNPDGKVFNQTYPGPWIQACWGDTIKVTVKNKLQFNGTTIHWHGIRQNGTFEMDGVNGVSQCPIAPEDSYTYEFKAVQYGSSWYHSHYSLQYADGLAGPITIYGPSSSNYDEGRDPILITDWSHHSAFESWQRELTLEPGLPTMNGVLINGIGNFAGSFPTERYNMTVTKGKKYILRIINTSVDTTWIFSIDNHNLTVMSTDFVPIKPYDTDHIVIGIGQRYHVVLNADPINTDKFPAASDGNYWIRTVATTGCQGFEVGNEPDERQGILRYNASSIDVPTTFRTNYSLACRDENYTSLEPILQWNVTPVDLGAAQPYVVGTDQSPNRPASGDNFAFWSFGANPMWLNFSDPTVLNLDNTTWDTDYVVVPDSNKGGWVYMAIAAPEANQAILSNKTFPTAAHPLHLHGHDFAILAQGDNVTEIANTTLKFDNPPRRDVALLQAGGFLVVAFKADNPGSWLFHCHIAWHASSGLAIQILERQQELQALFTEERLKEPKRVCGNWDSWFSDKANLWNATGVFQDDSGI